MSNSLWTCFSQSHRKIKSSDSRDFPGGPVVETLPSSAGSAGSILGQGAEIPHVLQPKSQNIKQMQYCNTFNKDFKVKVAQSCLTLYDPILQARILEWVPFASPGDLPNPGIEPRSPTLEADSLSAESQGKPKNTGVSRLSFIQGIFPIQESNWGLLHCRQVLYPLNYQGSPKENKKKESSDSSIRQTNSNLPSVILVLLRWANYLNSLSLNILICNKRDGIL